MGLWLFWPKEKGGRNGCITHFHISTPNHRLSLFFSFLTRKVDVDAASEISRFPTVQFSVGLCGICMHMACSPSWPPSPYWLELFSNGVLQFSMRLCLCSPSASASSIRLNSLGWGEFLLLCSCPSNRSWSYEARDQIIVLHPTRT